MHISKICSWIVGDAKAKYFVCANPHSLVVAGTDPLFSQAIHHADLVIPDGTGIVLASKLLRGAIRHRITGTDLFMRLNQVLHERGNMSCFFIGSKQEILDKMVSRMKKEFPYIQVVGTYSPPFKSEFNQEDNDMMIEIINRAKPDVLWVGMTAPKQEKWIMANRSRLNVKFIGAIGAVFHFYSGHIKRSHSFFQQLGLEWLQRLLREPHRLWRRTFISCPVFLYKVLRQKYSLRGNSSGK
ncbi:MAG: N-acetylglucosaminyldiphospho-UDP N-acetyl-beta-D-mannosaminyltransferase [Legionellales bacterium RIFCSPHIGHO2_12_FULL_37_14]|nr:MAG: N-acetylglucosaminyldiphospho-UDP N-acetyl-beta-D-mannosaminyltransferase [Legionellales bacterium RIFCSPHIGHO2_12_FULL_37_14]